MKHKYNETFKLEKVPPVPDSGSIDLAYYIKFADQPKEKISNDMIYKLQNEIPSQTMGVHAKKTPFSPKKLMGDILVINHTGMKNKKFKQKIIEVVETYSCKSTTFTKERKIAVKKD